eukprot:5805169-Prymnesium_polylepis.1
MPVPPIATARHFAPGKLCFSEKLSAVHCEMPILQLAVQHIAICISRVDLGLMSQNSGWGSRGRA